VASNTTASSRRIASSRNHPSHNVGSSTAPRHSQTNSGQ
jgi:hypothetical protein